MLARASIPGDGRSPTNTAQDSPLGSRLHRLRARWGRMRRTHPTLFFIVAFGFVALFTFDGWMIVRRRAYDREIARLRSSMTALELRRTDQIVSRDKDKLLLALELIRRPARLELALHLAISVDSGIMYLERDGALLRAMPVQIGPERRVGIPPDTVPLATPRGRRTIARVLSAADAWDTPVWVYVDRGIAVPTNRVERGALGPVAVILDGGTVIYSTPTTGALNDSGYVLPGAVRARAEDLRAIVSSLSAGMRVYFY